jgi:hypothetical protein
MRRPLVSGFRAGALLVLGLSLAAGCGVPPQDRALPTAPTATASPAGASLLIADRGGDQDEDVAKRPPLVSITDVTFPSRAEALLFRTALEAKYRDGLRRSAGSTYVDQEGTVVWTQEYLRYRVNLCPHSESVLRVLRQIDGQGIAPLCGSVNVATFPPRNEPVDFMVHLEAKYRDGLRRAATQSFVDTEGNVIWTQEYLRYRISTCSHTVAQQKVFDQIDGRGVQADCTPAPPPPPPAPPATSTHLLTLVSGQCGCVVGPIQIRADGTVVGTMRCPQTLSLQIRTGSIVSVCDDTGCWGTPFAMTGARSINLTCS